MPDCCGQLSDGDNYQTPPPNNTFWRVTAAGSWATSGDIQFYGIILLVAASFFVYFGFNGVIKENPVRGTVGAI